MSRWFVEFVTCRRLSPSCVLLLNHTHTHALEQAEMRRGLEQSHPCGRSLRQHLLLLSRAPQMDMLDESLDAGDLQHTATHCNTLQHTTTHCDMLQHTATRCNAQQTPPVVRTSDGYVGWIDVGVLQQTATHCHTLQYFATHCNVLQHTAPCSSCVHQWWTCWRNRSIWCTPQPCAYIYIYIYV